MRVPGEVKVFWGGMFSGKTTALIEELLSAGDGAICFKPKVDTRWDKHTIRTHSGLEFPVTPVERPSHIIGLLDSSITTVGIDEASLFLDDDSLIPTIEVIRDLGFNVVVSGLDKDRNGKPFGQMPLIAAIADQAVKLRARCNDCGNLASYSFLKGKDSDSIIRVGGEDEYEPLCRPCYYNKLTTN